MKIRRILLAPLALALAAPAAAPATRHDARPDVRTTAARPSLPPRAVARTGGRIDDGPLTRDVVVKFREGLEASVDGGAVALKGAAGGATAAIARAAVPGGVTPTFGGTSEALRAESSKTEAESGVDLADLSLYVDVETATPEDALRLAVELETFDEIECAYVRPAPPPLPPVRRAAAPAPADKTSAPIPDFFTLEQYLEKSPDGFGVAPVLDLPGGRGEGVRIVDIEYSWTLEHEDMPFAANPGQLFLDARGTDPVAADHGNHGTAALGMLVAVDNGFGTTGMCPAAQIGVINPTKPNASGGFKYNLEDAVRRAADVLSADGRRGDIIQIEQQAVGPNDEIAALPVEWAQAVYDAIRYAVARGLVVVEPAGNGGFKNGKGRGVSLDRADLQGRFDRAKRDSGAIVVGGAEPDSRVATLTTNYGSRVDVQGHGLKVTTLGYGDIFGGKKKKSRRFAYTGFFEGTSSATPCVTGAAALVQAAIRAHGLFELDSLQMRAVLAGTGAPDGSPRGHTLGPRPNAAAAAVGVSDPNVPLVTGVALDEATGVLTVDGIYFLGANAASDLRSVVYVNGTAVATQYVDGFPGPGGTTQTRVTATGVAGLIPVGVITLVTVGNAAGSLSPAHVFVRK